MGASPQVDWGALARKYGAVAVQPSSQVDWGALAKQYGATVGGESTASGSQPTAQPAAQPPSLGDKVVDALVAGVSPLGALWLTPGGPGVLRGMGEGALQTVASVSKLINKWPMLGEEWVPQAGINALEQLATPQTTPEKIGAVAEQGLEALMLGGVAPEIPLKGAVGTLGNIAVQGGIGALSNAMHGGSPLAGAAVGAGGEGALQAARTAAPGFVNSAFGFGWKSKQFGRDPGTVILDETKGLRPQTVLANIRKKIDAYTADLDAKAAADPNLKVSLEPVQQHILDLMEEFHNRNVYRFDPYLEELWDHVAFNKKAKVPFPPEVSGEQAVRLKRGLGDYVSESAWRPGAGSPMEVLAKEAQRVLGDTINRAVPGAEEKNWLLSNLLEAERRLGITTGSMGPAERAIDRLTRPTGALAGAMLGAQTGGVPGAIATVLAQEALRSPTFKLLLGRSMYAAPPVSAPIVRGLGIPLSALATKNKPDQNQPEM